MGEVQISRFLSPVPLTPKEIKTLLLQTREGERLGVRKATVALIISTMCLVAQLCPTLCNPMDCSLPGFSVLGDSHSLLQGIFPTQGSNPGLPHYRQILYHLNHQGSIISSELIKLSSYPNKLQPMREVGGGQKSCSEVGPSSFSAEKKDLISQSKLLQG